MVLTHFSLEWHVGYEQAFTQAMDFNGYLRKPFETVQNQTKSYQIQNNQNHGFHQLPYFFKSYKKKTVNLRFQIF